MSDKGIASLTLKPGREKSLLRRHPWVFSGAIARVDGNPASGETVDLVAADGQFLARAAFSPSSQIRARVWTFDPSSQWMRISFGIRIKNAIASREPWLDKGKTNAFRLIHAESDGLPGLIVDRYGDTLVLQSLTAGSEYWKETIATCCSKRPGCRRYSNVRMRTCVNWKVLLPVLVHCGAPSNPSQSPSLKMV